MTLLFSLLLRSVHFTETYLSRGKSAALVVKSTMAGDSPSPPRYRSRGNDSSGSSDAPPVNTNVRTLLIVGCILLVYLLISAPSDYEEYGYDNEHAGDVSGAAGQGGRIQQGPAPAPLIGPALDKARQPLTALKHKFRHLFDNTEYAGYGPNKPRIAVIIPDGDPHTVVGAVESVFR